MNEVFKGSTSHSVYFELVDSATGLPKTGIADTAVTGSYVRTRSARVGITVIPLALVTTAFTSGGWIEIDSTNQPGIYRFDVPDAAFLTGADEVVVTVKATGCRVQSRGFTLVDWNKQTTKVPATIASGDYADISASRAAKIDFLDATTSSRMAAFTLPANFSILSINGTGKVAATVATGDLTDLSASRAAKIDFLDATTSSRMATFTYTAPPTTGAIATAVEQQIMNEVDGQAVLQAIVDKINAADPNLSGLTLSAIAQAVRDVLIAGAAANSLGATIASINNKTINLPSDPASASNITSSFSTVIGQLNTIEDLLDQEMPALTVTAGLIKTVTDRLGTGLETPGGGVYRWTAASLINAPSSSGGSGLDATSIREAIGLEAANLDLQLFNLNTDVNTVLNSLGDFTGSGVNTVLGFFKALFRKDVATPSDIGGTFDPAVHSLEAGSGALTTEQVKTLNDIHAIVQGGA